MLKGAPKTPEGPECRKFAEDLARRLSYRKLVSIEVMSGRYLKKPPSGLDGFMGRLPVDIVGVGVHGKFIYWILKDELSIWNTLGMTGNWSSEQKKHSRIKFNLDNGTIYYNDARNFGTMKFVRGKFQLIEKLKSFGPDMLAEDVSDEQFISCIRKKPEWAISKSIMEQSVIAGVGNYIKADSLWLARISPHRLVKDLHDHELAVLNSSIKRVVRESFASGGATINSYETFSGDIGEYSQKFLVYNQKVDPDGNSVIKEMTADKRTTHWVPEIQV